jgi:hypothetical protein
MSPLSQFLAVTTLPMPVQAEAAGDVAMLWFATPADLEAWAAEPIGVTPSVQGEVIGNRKSPLWLYRFDDLTGYHGWLICEVAA